MRGRGRSGQLSVLCLKNSRYIRRGKFTAPDLHQSAHDVPHHLVEESIRADIEVIDTLVHGARVHDAALTKMYPIHGSRVAFLAAARRREGGKIALTDERLARRPHCVEIEFLADVPGIAKLERTQIVALRDRITIQFLRCESRHEALVRLAHLGHPNVARENSVQ